MANLPIEVQLVNAAREGNFANLKKIWQSGTAGDINKIINDDVTLLHWAAAGGNTDCIKFLLGEGADVNALSREGATPLFVAVSKNCVEAVICLMDAGADHLISFNSETPEQSARRLGHVMVAEMIKNIAAKNQVIFSSSVGDRIVEEIFHFGKKERFTYVRKPENRVVEFYTRDRFADVDEASLTKAFNEHVRRGGQTKYEDLLDGFGGGKKFMRKNAHG